MTGYFVRRFLWMIPVLLFIAIITFSLMHLVPGGPFEPGETKASEPGRQALIQKYHLNEPVYVQFFYWMRDVLHGDFGPDLVVQGTSVNRLLKQSWKPTIALGLLATIYAGTVGYLLGLLASIKRNSLLDYFSVGFATVGAAAPNFVLGIILVVIFAVRLRWVPAIGWATGPTDIRPVILPVIALGSLSASYIARVTRASMLEVMHQDYIRTARAKGLSERVVLMRHIVRNGMIPVLTLLGPIAAALLTGSFIIEQFFSIPGIGRAYVQAIIGRDYPMIMATTLIYGAAISVANLVVDATYAIFDPRIRYS